MKNIIFFSQIHEDYPDNIESLQYLEALCKDLGRPHDEFSKKLEKLRRNQPMASQVTSNTTTMRPGPNGRQGGGQTSNASSAPARTERPSRIVEDKDEGNSSR